MATHGVDMRPSNGINDLGRCRDTVASIEDNTHVPDTDPKRPDVRATPLTNIRSTLQEVCWEMENDLSSKISDENRNIHTKKRDTKSFKLYKQDSETRVKQLNDGGSGDPSPTNHDTSAAYARHIQVGSNNMMLVCEPKERERVYYKQVGDRNVMVNVTHNSHFYQLISLAREMDKPTIFPLTEDGELWVEIKRRSQLSKPQNNLSGTSSSCSSVSNENNENVPEVEPRLGREPSESSECSYTPRYRSRCAGEHEDKTATMEMRNSNEFDENAYSTITIDNEDRDSLSLKFEIKHSGKSFDHRHMQKSVLSHEKVRKFLTDEGNEFDVTIYDWEYQRESQYAYIPHSDDLEADDGPYSTVPGCRSIGDEQYSQVARTTPNSRRPREDELSARTGRQPTEHSCDAPRIPPRNYEPLGSVDTSKSKASFASNHSNSNASSNSRKSPTRRDDYLQVRPVEIPVPGSAQRSGYLVPSVPPRLTFGTSQASAPLDSFSWYKGKIDTQEAKSILRNKQNGTFLVRDATQGANREGSRMTHEYTIEFMDDKGKCKKLKIMKTDNKYHFKDFETTKFERLAELIQKIIASGLEIHDEKEGEWKTISVNPL